MSMSMNFTANTTTKPDIFLHSLYRYRLVDTTNDLIIGVVVLVLAILCTFVCCVTLAAKCSKEPRLQYQHSGNMKAGYSEIKEREPPVAHV